MLWFFERDDESLKLETRYDNDTSEFVVIVCHPDGRERIGRFTDGGEYGARLETFERTSALDAPRCAGNHAERLAEQATYVTLQRLALEHSLARRSGERNMAV